MSETASEPSTPMKVAATWVPPMARVGYAAKGLVYGLAGVLSLIAAIGLGGQTEGSKGTVGWVSQIPGGRVLCGLIAVGMACYVVWRLAQAFLDAEDAGTGAGGIFKRLGFLISALGYGSLTVFAVREALDLGGGDGGDGKKKWTAWLLGQPFGPWLVGAIGLVFIGVGIHHFRRAYKSSFMKHYNGDMSGKERRVARRIGQFGLSARGVTFCIIGGFFIQGGMHHDSDKAKGLGDAFKSLAAQPYGAVLLGVVAAGFVAYALYCFSRTRYRVFEVR